MRRGGGSGDFRSALEGLVLLRGPVWGAKRKLLTTPASSGAAFGRLLLGGFPYQKSTNYWWVQPNWGYVGHKGTLNVVQKGCFTCSCGTGMLQVLSLSVAPDKKPFCFCGCLFYQGNSVGNLGSRNELTSQVAEWAHLALPQSLSAVTLPTPGQGHM